MWLWSMQFKPFMQPWVSHLPVSACVLLTTLGVRQAVKQLNDAVSSLPAEADCDALLVMPLYAAMPPDMQVSHREWLWLLVHVQKPSCSGRVAAPVVSFRSMPDCTHLDNVIQAEGMDVASGPFAFICHLHIFLCSIWRLESWQDRSSLSVRRASHVLNI